VELGELLPVGLDLRTALRFTAPGDSHLEIELQRSVEHLASFAPARQFGRSRFLDVGDLTGPPLVSLACPSSPATGIGRSRMGKRAITSHP